MLRTVVVVSMLSLPAAASTLTWINTSLDAQRRLTLRRDDARIVIVDDSTRAVVASAAASNTDRVVIAGASGAHDDTLTLDLSGDLPHAIEFDGGADGSDSLIVTGGAVARERVTQLTPHDGIVELDDVVLRYTNLEPVTTTSAAASFTISGTAGADTVTISDGPAGQTTISSPTFESVSFANKTNVVFDGLGGGDTVTLNNPNAATGLASFIIQNVAAVSQTAPFNYPSFGISATGTVNLPDGGNDVTNIEIVAQNGDITYRDANAVTIGGVSSTLTGVRVQTSGSINFVTSGTITLADTDGTGIVTAGSSSGDVTMQSFGIGSDIIDIVDNAAIIAPHGSITVTSGGDILLGTTGTDDHDDIRARSAITMTALRDIVVDGASHVLSDDFGGNTFGPTTATAGRDFVVTDAHGTSAVFGGTSNASATINATTGEVRITADGDAVRSDAGNVRITTTRFILDAGSFIFAPDGPVFITSSGVPVDLGSTTDAAAALEISDAEIDRIKTTNELWIEAGAGMSFNVTQPVSTSVELLLLLGSGTFSGSGTGSITAPQMIVVDKGATGRNWTITPAAFTISPGSPIPYDTSLLLATSGSGNDAFAVTPSTVTTISVDGKPASTGDSLSVDLTGTTSPFLTFTDAPGYAGTYTFGNRQKVLFDSIEILDAATDVSVTKTDGSTTAAAGADVTYTITASNAGPLGMNRIKVTDVLPAELSGRQWTCVASAGSTCNPSGTDLIAETVVLAAGGTATFTATGTLPTTASGTLTNTATIQLPTPASDTSPSNNSATDSDEIIYVSDLSLALSSEPATYTNGTTISYTIDVANAGPSDAANVVLTDVLPPDTTFISISAPAGFTCTTPDIGENGTVTCTAPLLADGVAQRSRSASAPARRR